MKHKKIEFVIGSNIESAVKQLSLHRLKGELVFGDFNGKKLYSDVDNIDTSYKKITGKTKFEFDEESRKRNDEYELEKKNHEDSIPELTKDWIEKGKLVLDEKYLELWTKIVPIRLSDLYQGMELGNCLDIVKELNYGCNLDVAKGVIESQGHSGMSFGLVCAMVKTFCDRGVEFVNYINKRKDH